MVTEVLFYSNVADRLRAACQISAKALSQRRRVMILTTDANATEQVSRLLWTTPAIGFYPHCTATDRLAPVTPIIIDHRSEPMVHDDVLINLADETPDCFSRFHRLVEIVSEDDAERAAARERYRFYRDRGYPIKTHVLGKGEERSDG